jgi:RHS repeat-associated protein
MYDGDTGLNYAGARYYDASIGRFISQDPVSQMIPEAYLTDPQRANMYAYARNNPMNRIDPTGLYDMKNRTVEKGDTMASIDGAINTYYGTRITMDDLAIINGINACGPLKVGSTVSVGTINSNGSIWTPPMFGSTVDANYWGGLTGTQQMILNYGRNFYQDDIPPTTSAMKSGEWSSLGEAVAHNLNGESGNVDYRGIGARSGQQAIYDSSGKLVTSPENEGTYDFASPLASQLDHYNMDVAPWISWGNSPKDTTTGLQRVIGFISGLMGRYLNP